ncbi:hypothetical protein HDU76_009012 [Blyttiomyces sp. JEL0837]|nr:hypothetical protein HDU76_009012 [Blyttiomyces sp. JEL0837]
MSGFIATLIQSAFFASQSCNVSDPTLNILNGINNGLIFAIFESSTVLYSYIKTSLFISHKRLKQFIDVIMVLLFFAFLGFRINVARLGLTGASDSTVSYWTGYAFAVWGTADMIVLILLMCNVVELIRTSNTRTWAVFSTVLKSSVPRMLIIFLNTLSLVAVSFIQPQSEAVAELNQFNFMVKGTYPLILLVDILLTRGMLLDLRDEANQFSGEYAVDQIQGGQGGAVVNGGGYKYGDIESTGSNSSLQPLYKQK